MKSITAILILSLAAFTMSAEGIYPTSLIHSHNDYRREVPFYQAYSQHVYSIEADVFLKDGKLLVGHDIEELDETMTLESLYVNPLITLFDRNGGKPYADGSPLQLMIELKSETEPALEAVVALLSRRRDVFDPEINPAAVSIVITGRVPEPQHFDKYPEFVGFDGGLDVDYTPGQLERIALVSLNFRDYSNWNGKGSLVIDESRRVREAISRVHSLGKPIRFWNAPESITAYYTFYNYGVDYFNTDYPEICTDFFNDPGNKNFQIGQVSENEGITGTKKLDRATRDFKGFINEELTLDSPVETYLPTYASDGRHRKIRNVIFLIGDGMGLNQITAGAYANKSLSLFNFRSIGLCYSNSGDEFTTDSAAGGSALATGVSHWNRHISMTSDSTSLPSLSDYFHNKGKKIGVLTLGNVVDATPTAFYAHHTERDSSDALTSQIQGGPLHLLCGSGSRHFVSRNDGRNLFEDLSPEFNIVSSVDEINSRAGKVICIDERMEDAARKDNVGLLAEAVDQAIEKLDGEASKGFFLMVEGAKIDYAGHSRCLPGSVMEMLSFDMAVREALKFADKDGSTLVVVTADHETGGLVLLDGDFESGRIRGVYVSDDHTPSMLPVFAYGPWSDAFNGVYKNTAIPNRIKELTR